MKTQPHFGATFIKKPVKVILQTPAAITDPQAQNVNVIYTVDGSTSSMPKQEFLNSYQPAKDKDHWVSKPSWKDIQLVPANTLYKTIDGNRRRANSGVLVREASDANAFYEISPFYAIGIFTPAKDPLNPRQVDPVAKQMQTEILNIAHLKGPIRNIGAIRKMAFNLLFYNRPYVLAVAGYSDATPEYAASAQAFLQQMVKALGVGKVGFITSPTATKNSIDALVTEISQPNHIPLIYVTAEEFLEYIEPSKFPKSINQQIYAITEKFFFKKPKEYSAATAKASNVCLVIGGRNAAVRDTVNALKNANGSSSGNKLIIYNDLNLAQPAWDDTKQRVDNASKYLIEQLKATLEGHPLPYIPIEGLTPELLKTAYYENKIRIITIPENTLARRRNTILQQELRHLDAFIEQEGNGQKAFLA